ncbi:MAG: T9SS type A sorting domain-containing protein [Bacteroidetes bacterium]|nr:T9SS type A sorting domain-containing protein [Bacteroidota bacterium]
MKHLLAALLLFICVHANAQYTYGRYGFNDTTGPAYVKNNFTSDLHAFNNTFYLYASDTAHGAELWKADGINPPVMVADINPGHGDAVLSPMGGYSYDRMCYLNGLLYFAANDGIHGIELWKYDGTNPPSMVLDILPGKPGSSPAMMRVINGKIYFDAYADSTTSVTTYYARLHVYDPGTNTATAITNGSMQIMATSSCVYNGKLAYTNYFDSSMSYIFDPATGIHTKMQGYYGVRLHYVYNNKLYMVGSKTYVQAIRALLEYDGTNLKQLTCAGSPNTNVLNVLTGLSQAYVSPLKGYNNEVYFRCDTAGIGGAIGGCKYNQLTGTVTTLNNSVYYEDNNGVEYNGKLITTGYMPGLGTEVCVYSTTDTVRLLNMTSYKPDDIWPDNFVLANNIVLFLASPTGMGSLPPSPPSKLYRLIDTTIPPSHIIVPENDITLKAYPNPANNVFNLELNMQKAQTLQVALIDASGRQVYTSGNKPYNAGINTISIPVADLPAGNYFFRIMDDKGYVMARGKMVH